MRNKFVLFIFFVFFLSNQSESREGGISSNGGDGISAEFFQISRDLLKMLEQKGTTNIDLNLFKETINSARVFSVEKAYLNNREVGAINTPSQQTIEVSRSHWKILKDFPKQKYILVLHEFLGLMNYDDKTFNISNNLIDGPGILINQISCPFLQHSTFLDANRYSLELTKYQVDNFYEYKVQVYKDGLPDSFSETISVDQFRWLPDHNDILKPVIITQGTSRIMSDNPFTKGLLVYFEIWPGNIYSGNSNILSEEGRFEFNCRGNL